MIQEAGVAREVLSVRPADYPIVVLLDTGSEATRRLSADAEGGRAFHRPDRPAADCARHVRRHAEHAHDLRGRAADGAGEAGGDAAETSAGSLLLQGASLAARTIRATGTLFSCIVILSATAADASQDAPDEMIAPMVDSNATLHVIANRPGQTAAGGQRANPALRALAEQSRGEFTVIYSAASYQAALDRLADRLTSEMMIEYLVPVGSKPNDVKVGVRIVGARVRGLGVAPR